ncbi:hypothetical protein FOFC_03175 [Fusarium oxysporum]|nr:hypothetical protein FOFC_03175 [Fusarium oxysporum]
MKLRNGRLAKYPGKDICITRLEDGSHFAHITLPVSHHAYACSGPAVLKLISTATAQKPVTLVHPAFHSTPTAPKKLKFDHQVFPFESNIHDIDLDELDLDELGIKKLGIDHIIMEDFDIGDFDINEYIYAYMIDLDKSTLKVYQGYCDPVCEYTFAELQRFTEAEFIGRYRKKMEYEENPDNMPEYKVMLAGSLCHNSHVEKALDLDKKFELCSTFWQNPTHLLCTQAQFSRRKKIPAIVDAMKNRIPICKCSSSNSEWMNLDKEKNILWHPKYGSK